MSALADFQGASDDVYLDPRVAFYEHFRLEFGSKPIYILIPDHQERLLDSRKMTVRVGNWSHRPDLHWIVRELAPPKVAILTERERYLRACFQLVAPEQFSVRNSQGLCNDREVEVADHSGPRPDGASSDGQQRQPALNTGDSGENERRAVSEDIENNVNDRWDEGQHKFATLYSDTRNSQENDDDSDSVFSSTSDGSIIDPKTYSCRICSRPDTIKMISCSSDNHADDLFLHWFHHVCVGLRTNNLPNADVDWFCPECDAGNPAEGLAANGDNNFSERTAGHRNHEHQSKRSANSRDSRYSCDPDNLDDLDFDPSVRKRSPHPRRGKVGPDVVRPYIYTKRPCLFTSANGIGDDSQKSGSNVLIASTSHSPTEHSPGSGTRRDVRPWTDSEKQQVKDLMEEIVSQGTPESRTERRWAMVSDRLAILYGTYRTWTSIKNYWNREGRKDSKIDERNIKQPDRMVTGVQDKQQRQWARQAKRKRVVVDNSNQSDDYADTPCPKVHR